MLGRPTVRMPALSRPGADFSRTQECTGGRVWRGQKAANVPRHSRDTKKGTNGGKVEGREGSKRKAAGHARKCENDFKTIIKNHYTGPLSSFPTLGPSYINSNKSKPEGQTKKVRDGFTWEM